MDDEGKSSGEELRKRAGLNVRILKISTKYSLYIVARPIHNQAVVELPTSCSALYKTPLLAYRGVCTILRLSPFLALSEGRLLEHFSTTGSFSKEIFCYRMFVLARNE